MNNLLIGSMIAVLIALIALTLTEPILTRNANGYRISRFLTYSAEARLVTMMQWFCKAILAVAIFTAAFSRLSY